MLQIAVSCVDGISIQILASDPQRTSSSAPHQEASSNRQPGFSRGLPPLPCPHSAQAGEAVLNRAPPAGLDE